jgi:hypothetical protein
MIKNSFKRFVLISEMILIREKYCNNFWLSHKNVLKVINKLNYEKILYLKARYIVMMKKKYGKAKG